MDTRTLWLSSGGHVLYGKSSLVCVGIFISEQSYRVGGYVTFIS